MTGEVRSFATVEYLELAFTRIEPGLWQVAWIAQAGPKGVPANRDLVTLDVLGATPGDCSRSVGKFHSTDVSEICLRSEVVGEADRTSISASLSGIRGRLDGESRLVALIAEGAAVLSMSDEDVGFLTAPNGLSVSLPRISVFETDYLDLWSKERVSYDVSLATGSGRELVWTGRAPSVVEPLRIGWTYDDRRWDPAANVSQGVDPSISYADQVRAFLAGVLAGLATAALLGAIQELVVARSSKVGSPADGMTGASRADNMPKD